MMMTSRVTTHDDDDDDGSTPNPKIYLQIAKQNKQGIGKASNEVVTENENERVCSLLV